MMALDKDAPLAVSLNPDRFQAGMPSEAGETGDISAMGLPCLSIRRFFPPSTSESSSEACLRNSVKVTVFMSSPPDQNLHINAHYFVQLVKRISMPNAKAKGRGGFLPHPS